MTRGDVALAAAGLALAALNVWAWVSTGLGVDVLHFYAWVIT